jgi:hypothetical protein
MIKSLWPYVAYIFMICQRMGLLPISIIGFGFRWLSSEIRVPSPPAKMTTFIGILFFLAANQRFVLAYQEGQN